MPRAGGGILRAGRGGGLRLCAGDQPAQACSTPDGPRNAAKAEHIAVGDCWHRRRRPDRGQARLQQATRRCRQIANSAAPGLPLASKPAWCAAFRSLATRPQAHQDCRAGRRYGWHASARPASVPEEGERVATTGDVRAKPNRPSARQRHSDRRHRAVVHQRITASGDTHGRGPARVETGGDAAVALAIESINRSRSSSKVASLDDPGARPAQSVIDRVRARSDRC